MHILHFNMEKQGFIILYKVIIILYKDIALIVQGKCTNYTNYVQGFISHRI